jgi:hypothetical protein
VGEPTAWCYALPGYGYCSYPSDNSWTEFYN